MNTKTLSTTVWTPVMFGHTKHIQTNYRSKAPRPLIITF